MKLKMNGKRASQAVEISLDAPKLAMTDAKVSGGKVSSEAKLVEGGRNLYLSFSAPSFDGSPQAFRLPSLNLDAGVRDAKLDAKANITGTVSGDIDKLLFSSPQLKLALSGKQDGSAIAGTVTTPLKANLKSSLIELPVIVMAMTLPNPGGGMLKLNASGAASMDLGKQRLSTELKGQLDDSAFNAKLGMSQFSPAAYSFDIAIDRLNADSYQAGARANAASSKSTEKSGAQSAEKPLDLSGLRDLQASGVLRVGALTLNNIRAANVRVNLRVTGGKIDLNPLSASLYGGNAAGSISGTATAAPRIAVRQSLTGINVGRCCRMRLERQRLKDAAM